MVHGVEEVVALRGVRVSRAVLARRRVRLGGPPINTIKGRCEPAYTVVRRIGSLSIVAKVLKLDVSTVSRWVTGERGSRGRIPQEYWPRLLAWCRFKNIPMDVYDLSGIPRP